MKNTDSLAQIPLTSSFQFFDLFLDKSLRSQLPTIPETILFYEGAVKAWFFPSKSDPHLILQKKPENSTIQHIIRRFFGNFDVETFKLEQSHLHLSTNEKFKPIVVVGMYGKRNLRIVDKNELYTFLTERKESLVFLQEIIAFQQRPRACTTLETFQCEFRENKGIRNFLFLKRFVIYDDKRDNPHSEAYIPDYWKLRTKRGKMHDIENKSLDKRVNAVVEENMAKLIGAIEKKGSKVVKAIGKFLIDELGNCYFRGLKDVFIEYKPEKYENSEIPGEIELEELIEKKIVKEKVRIKVRKNLKGVYSLNLRRGLMEEHCEGDFCDFVGLKMMKGGLEELPTSKYLTEEQRVNFNRNKELLYETYNPKQPFQISSLLLKKIYQNKQYVSDILINSGILPQNNEEPSEFHLELKENHLLNKKNLIKFVKICANCFYIYNFLHERLAARELTLVRSSSDWLHREKRFSHTFNESLKVLSSKYQKKGYFSRDLSRLKETNSRFGEQGEGPQKSCREKESEEEYSFLKKQTIGSHVLNLGFTSSFRTTFRLEDPKETSETYVGPSVQKQNLFELFAAKQEELEKSPSLLRKKTAGFELQKEYSRKSSNEVLKLLNSPQSGSNLKQKRESIQQVISSKKILQARPSIQIKKRLSVMPSYLRNSLMSKQSMPFKASDISSRSFGIFHHNPKLFRNLPSFRISTPKLSIVDGLNPFLDYRDPCSMDFAQLLKMVNLSTPEIDQTILEKVQVFIVDENTAIPYVLLNNSHKQSQNINEQNRNEIDREVLVVILDFFDNLFNLVDFFMFYLKKSENLNILLFNYPGQAYTYFSPAVTYNNVYNATLLDLLLFELQKKGHFLIRSDNFRLLGFGNGANILSFFLTLHDNSIVNLKQFLLFNPFLYIDDMLADILNKSIEVFSKFPLESPELCLIYEETFNRQMTEKPDFSNLKERFALNPITIEGRISILNGVLENVNIAQNVNKLRTPLRVIFSQRNPLINVTHLDLILKNEENHERKVEFYQRFCQEKRDLKTWFASKDSRMALILEEGGYNLLEDQKKITGELLGAFLGVDLKKNLTQRIALIDIKINRLEKRIVGFFMKYVEKLIEFTEYPFDQVKSMMKLGTVFDVYREKYFRISKENEENSREYDWIHDEYRFCKERVNKNNEEFDEFYERNEKTLNIQTKKLSDLKSNLSRIGSEFLAPYKLSLRGLMYFKLYSDIQQGVAKNLEIFEKFKQKIQNFDGTYSEDEVINSAEVLMKPESCHQIGKNTKDRKNSIEKSIKIISPKLGEKLSKIKDNLQNNGRRSVTKLKTKLVSFIRSCFEKILYLLEVKAEVFENFSEQSEIFENLETEALSEFREFFADTLDFESKASGILKGKKIERGFLEELMDYYRQMFIEINSWENEFQIDKIEDRLMFEGMESEEKAKKEENSMENIVTETNISDFSSYGNLVSYSTMGKSGRKYREGLLKGENAGKLYEQVTGRIWMKDEEFLKEAEKNIEDG